MLEDRRVVVTGIGAITSVGNNVLEIWESLLTGKSGLGPITKFDAEDHRTKIAGEVKNLDLHDSIPSKDAKRLDPFCHYAVISADEAITDSGLDLESEDKTRIGVLVGSGIGGIITLENQLSRLAAGGPSRVSPFLVPMMIGDMAAGAISIRFRLQGPNFGIASACATGCHAIGEAYWILRRGDADVMLAGGTEACVSPISMAGFSSMKAMSVRNDEPQKASRPFDADRDGFVLAEGAGVLTLETLEHAKARGADIHAEILGYGASGDAYHMTSPPPDSNGAIIALNTALKHAKINVDEISYINAHGTGTILNDRNETLAIKKVFGRQAYAIPVTSTKSLTGHTLGAAGAIETIICAKAIGENSIPGTYNYETPDPDCDLDYVPNQSLEKEVKVALNLNFGFGGHNAVVALGKYEN